MKTTLAVILAASAAASLVGCARTPNPAVVSTPAVIERTQVQTPAAGATVAPSCTWASQSFSSGATSCQNHLTYKCNNGTWEQLSAPAC